MYAILKNIAVVGLVAALPACAGGDGRYPSLALRPFETNIVPTAPTLPPEQAQPIRPVTTPGALAAMQDKATNAHAAFLTQEIAAAGLVRAAAGQPIESDARAAALVAMADLASQRGVTSAVLADLDLLAAQAAAVFAPDPALSATQAEITALLARADAGMARLWETMGS